LKYLVIAVLVALVFILLYRRVRPYIELFQKITGVASSMLDPDVPPSRTMATTNKLSRCVACATWVPAERAIRVGNTSVYCSRECLEKVPAKRKDKLAG
jgi:hypothetical protein